MSSWSMTVCAAVVATSCAMAEQPGTGEDNASPANADATPAFADARVWRSPDAMLPPPVDASTTRDARVDAWVPPIDAGMSLPDGDAGTTSGDAGSGGSCAHSPCDLGGALSPVCDPCVEAVCNLDFYCCLVEWDVSCKNAYTSCGSCS